MAAQPAVRRSRGVRRALLFGLLGAGLAFCGPAVPPLMAAAADGTPAAGPAVLPVEGAEDPVAHRPAVGVVPRVTTVAPAPVTSAPVPATSAATSTAPRPTGSARLTGSALLPAPTAPEPVRLPLGVQPPGAQVVTVVGASRSATTAKLTAWELGPEGWHAVLGPVTARVGAAGIGTAGETSTRTPAGTFTLTEAFGRAADPGTALPYRVVDGDDWWVSDPASPRYNQYAECAPGTCDFDESAAEDLYGTGAVYDNAVVIDYNRAGRPGAGSAFFLHVSNGAPTAGCVAVDRGSLQTLLRWLDPAAAPVIAIGVG